MISLIAFWLLAAAPSPVTELAGCIERKDQGCISSLLRQSPAQATPEYFALAAQGYMVLRRPKEAAASVASALRSDPSNYDWLLEQGWIQQKSGDEVSAVRSFLLAAQSRPGAPAPFYDLGMSFFLLGEYGRAERHFRHVLDLDSKFDRAEFMLGVIDIMDNREPDAAQHYERALALQPENPHYLLHYGVYLNQFGQTDKGLDLMNKAEHLDPANPLTHYNLGRAYLQKRDLSRARTELEAAIRLKPGLTPAYYKLGSVYREMDDQEKARKVLDQYRIWKQREERGDIDPTDAILLEK